VGTLAEELFRHFEAGVHEVHGQAPAIARTGTGWPPVPVRRAG
jgi:hypothetical protein